jgi:hypothetical protein
LLMSFLCPIYLCMSIMDYLDVMVGGALLWTKMVKHF